MIIDNKAYIANVGDSRAIMSAENGQLLYRLTKDHKPDAPLEKLRIEQMGGSVYQSQIVAKPPFSQFNEHNPMWMKIGLFPTKPVKFPED
jgi:serine/threonine protein phosphatase PrpC